MDTTTTKLLTSNSASSVLENVALMTRNSIEILSALSQSVSSSDPNISLKLSTGQNTSESLNIPSFYWIQSELIRLDKNIQSLSAIDQSDVTVRLADGSYKKIISTQFLREPNKIGTLDYPSQFFKKSNYFFEKLMSPMIFIGFDISNYISDSIRSVAVKRLILQIDTIDKQNLFSENINKKNNLSHDDLLVFLLENNVVFFSDESVLSLPLSIARYSGSFDVIEILDTTSISTGEISRRYRLNTIRYNDNLSNLKGTLILKPGDVLVLNETKFAVDIVNVEPFRVE